MSKLITSRQKFFRSFCYYSGGQAIWEKMKPPVKPTVPKPATFPLWILGIYVALFGIASQRYENRVDIIENRSNAIFAQLATSASTKALSRVPRVQRMPCPVKPEIFNPYSVIQSLFVESRYPAIVESSTSGTAGGLKNVNRSKRLKNHGPPQRWRRFI